MNAVSCIPPRECLVLAALAIVYAAGNVVFFRYRFVPEDDLPGSILMGWVPAQASLLAIWAAIGEQPFVARIPKVLWLVALMAIAVVWGRATREELNGTIEELCVFYASPFLVLWGFLAILRWCFRWRIGRPGGEVENSCVGTAQFSLRSLFVWIAGTAFLLGLARWIVPDPGLLGDFDGDALLLGLIVGAVYVFLVVPCVGFALGEKKRILFFIAMVATCGAVPCAFALWIWGYAKAVFILAGSISLGICAFVCASLLLIRGCGFRLLSKRPAVPISRQGT